MCLKTLFNQLTGRLVYAVLGALIAILLVVPAKSQSLIGGGVQIKHSTSFHSDDVDPGAFIYAQTTFKKRFKASFIGEFSSEPELPSLFQSDGVGTKMDGSEFRARPELQFTLGAIRAIKPFVRIGGDYYRQSYPNLRQGLGHYRTGLNPLTSVGVDVGKHSLYVTRIWQELKVKRFKYYTFNVIEHYQPGHEGHEGYEIYEYVPQLDLGNKGTFNPTYLQGWQLNYQYIRPIKKNLSLYFGAEGKYLDYRKSVDRTYVSYYREKDTILVGRVGVLWGR